MQIFLRYLNIVLFNNYIVDSELVLITYILD
jgi:hypothetical protein